MKIYRNDTLFFCCTYIVIFRILIVLIHGENLHKNGIFSLSCRDRVRYVVHKDIIRGIEQANSMLFAGWKECFIVNIIKFICWLQIHFYWTTILEDLDDLEDRLFKALLVDDVLSKRWHRCCCIRYFDTNIKWN